MTSVAFSADSARFASASLDKTLKLWDVETCRDIMTITRDDAYVTAVTFSPDGRHVVAGTGSSLMIFPADDWQ